MATRPPAPDSPAAESTPHTPKNPTNRSTPHRKPTPQASQYGPVHAVQSSRGI
ncbi:hypothetical protein AOQ84DRAFT_352442 [Glonium stellatum]|uniref:Uncharacterized protein n=1 Tax=Glonium stellatum TaxID=574774 RepID=A0A8E2JWU6_9PEZI|nr:hypothetical protein AOQ84DRAFT_352442 [Glonium stellatum]